MLRGGQPGDGGERPTGGIVAFLRRLTLQPAAGIAENNDPLEPSGPGKNDAGGILGGISCGAPVILRLAVKPTASIARVIETMPPLLAL